MSPDLSTGVTGKYVHRWVVIALMLASVLLGGLGTGVAGSQPTGTPASTPAASGVVREILSSGEPIGAPGELLELVRYTIPGGTQLPAHTHPGVQAATIVSGVLSYTVVEGAVPLRRAGSDVTEAITPERGEVDIQPGDSFVEPEGVIHFGRNAGTEPIVILVASLFTIGETPAHVIAATPVATPQG